MPESANLDAQLEDAIAESNLPTLLVVLHHLTGDERWLSPPYVPQPIPPELLSDDSGGFSPAIEAEIRAAALPVLRDFIDRPEAEFPALDRTRINRMMSISLGGEPVGAEETDMLLEEMGLHDRDVHLTAPVDPARLKDFAVTIIGAGMSGLCIAIKLKQAGIAFRIIEKNDAVGGTWYENDYPACGVDTPNYVYAYSFAKNPDWSGYFSKQRELFEYFDRCTDEFDIRDDITFSTEVTRAEYRDSTWSVTTLNSSGASETFETPVLISAVGQLNRPKLPDIRGLDDYTGPKFHSARWEYEHELTGKRVGVIGTGCSAMQFMPHVVDRAAEVKIFQRTPNWILPAPDYYRPVAEGHRWLLRHVPFYQAWNRFRSVRRFGDTAWPAAVKDPSWQDGGRSISEVSDQMRQALTDFMAESVGADEALLDKVVPTFPVFGKRLVIDNDWFPTITQDHVELVTQGIEQITPTGIDLDDGTSRALDVIILATGFETNRFLFPMDIRGKSGTSLADRWGDDPRAYLGMTIPDYPNLFCLYGPNTNIVHGGSIIYQVECQVRYIMSCIVEMIERDIVELECRDDVNLRYNEEVQALSKNLAWGHPDVDSWYKNSAGRVVNNSPFNFLEFWQRTHDPDFSDFELQTR